MADIWKADPEVYKTAQALIASSPNLKDLALVDDQILIVFKEKATVCGDVTIPGQTSKASNLLGVVSDTPYKFVITLAGDEWQSLSNEKREALLFHYLCACGVEENPDTGEIRCFRKLPHVSFFREETEKYGFWRTGTIGKKPAEDLINELFGEKPDPVKKKQKGKGGNAGP